MDQTEQNRRFIQRLGTWWEAHSEGVRALAAGELAPGIVCIADEHKEQGRLVVKEVDIFFDRTRYRLRRPTLWRDSQTNGLEEAELGYLPGICKKPGIRTPSEAFALALKEIGSRDDRAIEWGEFRLEQMFQPKLLTA